MQATPPRLAAVVTLGRRDSILFPLAVSHATLIAALVILDHFAEDVLADGFLTDDATERLKVVR